MARRPAKPKAAAAARPQNTEGTEDSLKGAQATDKAEVLQQPSDTNGGGQTAAIAPPGPETPPADPAPAAEAGLAAVMSAVVPGVPLFDVPTSVTPIAAAPVTPLPVPEPPAPAAAPVLPPPSEPQGILVVTGPKRGRWRAGRHFGAEPVRIPLADVTEDERTAIEGDAALGCAVEPEV